MRRRRSRDVPAASPPDDLDRLLAEIRACRLCRDAPQFGRSLPHEPRPVVVAQRSARIAVCGQAPGTRVHASGVPFSDPSGKRLRAWMGVSEAEFYDASRVAILPMGMCFPGLDAKGGDLPPRRECAPLWRDRLLSHLDKLELILAIGVHAHRWHLGAAAGAGVTHMVKSWKDAILEKSFPTVVALPHPSWRNNAWLADNPWFDAELVPWLRGRIRATLGPEEARVLPRQCAEK
jgi:uracil-DNA glycosylase